jgi:hypothetical protein
MIHMDNTMEPVKEEIDNVAEKLQDYAEKKSQELFIFSKSDEGQAYYTKLSTCNCCSRHARNKPALMKDGWLETRNNNTRYTEQSCQCDCRHMMRFMARLYNPNKEFCYPITQDNLNEK